MTKRGLILIAVAVLIAACIKKAKSHQESEWHGLTESEARSKLDAKLPSRMPDEKRAAVSDKIVAKMHERGVIREDGDVDVPPHEAPETVDLRQGTGEATEPAQN